MKTEFGSWDKSTRRIPTVRSFVPHSTKTREVIARLHSHSHLELDHPTRPRETYMLNMYIHV